MFLNIRASSPQHLILSVFILVPLAVLIIMFARVQIAKRWHTPVRKFEETDSSQ